MAEPKTVMIPTHIYICGSLFAVIRGGMADRLGIHGITHPSTTVIYLSSQDSEEFLRETLLHEIIHGVDFLTNGDPNQLLEQMSHEAKEGFRLNEECVLAFSRGMFMTLSDPRNQETIQWVLGTKL